MLFGVFLVLVIVAVGLGAYSLGALLGNRPRQSSIAPVTRVVQLPALRNPPPIPQRMARGTTPQPIKDESSPRGVVSNRDDATEPEISPDSRFSVRRSSKRIQ